MIKRAAELKVRSGTEMCGGRDFSDDRGNSVPRLRVLPILSPKSAEKGGAPDALDTVNESLGHPPDLTVRLSTKCASAISRTTNEAMSGRV